MRYIRTKNEIIDLKSDAYTIEKNGDTTLFGYPYIKKEEIVVQANTIEKLCDEFVLISPVFAYPNRLTKDRLNDLVWLKKHNSEDCKNDTAYGAIWTDKGLIYVAKMNEKGDLELL